MVSLSAEISEIKPRMPVNASVGQVNASECVPEGKLAKLLGFELGAPPHFQIR